MKFSFLRALQFTVVAGILAAIGGHIYAAAYIATPTPDPVEFTVSLPEGTLVFPTTGVAINAFKVETELNEWQRLAAEGTNLAPPIVTYEGGVRNDKPAAIFSYWLSRKDNAWYHTTNIQTVMERPETWAFFVEVPKIEYLGVATFRASIERAPAGAVVVVIGTLFGVFIIGLVSYSFVSITYVRIDQEQ